MNVIEQVAVKLAKMATIMEALQMIRGVLLRMDQLINGKLTPSWTKRPSLQLICGDCTKDVEEWYDVNDKPPFLSSPSA
jgi:hypothetical protein